MSEDIFADSPIVVGEVTDVILSEVEGTPHDQKIKIQELFPDESIYDFKVGDYIITQTHKDLMEGDKVILGFTPYPENVIPAQPAIVGGFPLVIDQRIDSILKTIRKHGINLDTYSDNELYDLYNIAGSDSCAYLHIAQDIRRNQKKTNKSQQTNR